MYEQVDPTVHVYAPEGEDVRQHLARIERYNAGTSPTSWQQEVYTGPDYLDRMLADRAGNVIVVSGNNGRKTEYIEAAVKHGLNVLADKPMVIDPAEYELLARTLDEAEARGVLVYDIMTERFEITTMLQRALSRQTALFGELVTGSVEEPAISKESVHHFSKEVSGAPLIRPAWFFDVKQQGEGIVDVATHLVDLVLWETFPDQAIATSEVEVVRARRWATRLSREQFSHVTGEETFPDYLQSQVKDGHLEVFANGEIDFTVRGVHGKVSVIWNYEAPPGAADTHYSVMRGTRANLIIRQDAEQGYTPTLYVEPVGTPDESTLRNAIDALQSSFPGIAYRRADTGYEITVPPTLRTGHEDHFGQVTEQYLRYLTDGNLPAWERANILTKYFVTTEAYKMSR
nr:putative oxidoreductase C-terminal domain-containing protein [Lewinella sp. JB7]